ncbi:MAG: hypothetical protein AAF267_22195, partial [Deinococcota bacterium]
MMGKLAARTARKTLQREMAVQRCVAQVRHTNGDVIGTAFLVRPSYLLTCAHVVDEALQDDALQDDVLQDDALQGSPLGGNPLRGDTPRNDSLGADNLAADSLGVNNLAARKPTSSSFASSRILNQDTYSEDIYNMDAYTKDAYSEDAYTKAPLASDVSVLDVSVSDRLVLGSLVKVHFPSLNQSITARVCHYVPNEVQPTGVYDIAVLELDQPINLQPLRVFAQLSGAGDDGTVDYKAVGFPKNAANLDPQNLLTAEWLQAS